MSQKNSTTGRGALYRRFATVGAFAATVAVAGALTLSAPLSASAADIPQSYAKGQFLSGSVLGTDLAKVLSVASAEARNDGTQDPQLEKDPLKVTALDAVTVGDGSSVQLGLGDFLQLGAVAQYAKANKDGSALGASGAVADDGAIGVGKDTSTPPANATFDLSKLLGAQFASTLADLKLQLGAIAAQANGTSDTASGAYTLANAKLSFTSPAVAQLTEKVDSAIDSMNSSLGGLGGSNGDLVKQLNALLPLSGSGVSLLGNDASVTATVDTGNLKNAVQSLLNAQYGDGSVAFNLETGTVTLDLAKLLGGKLNNLAPGTELIDAKVIDGVLDGITTTVSTISDQVIDKVKQLLNNATVTITVHAAVSVAQAPLQNTVCKIVQQVIPGVTSTIQQLVPGASGTGSGSTTGTDPITGTVQKTVGGILGGSSLGNVLPGGTGDAVGQALGQVGSAVGQVANSVGQTVTKTVTTPDQIINTQVCDKVSTPVAPKLTQLDVNITGSAKQLIAGGAATANVSLKVLDVVNASLDVKAILAGLGTTLSDRLFGTDGAITQLTTALNDGLVHPAVEGLVGPGTGPVSDALTKLLSVKVNLQETSTGGSMGMAAQAGKMFTETAVRVTVLGGVGSSSLATVNLAQATVGMNEDAVVTPPTCTSGSCTPTTCTTDCGTGTHVPVTPAGRLATTGISIAALVAAMLALLAAGAYLVREGYKRRRLTSVS